MMMTNYPNYPDDDTQEYDPITEMPIRPPVPPCKDDHYLEGRVGVKPKKKARPATIPQQKVNLAKLARANSSDAFLKIVELSQNPDISPAVQLDSAKYILERGYGKIAQVVEIDAGENLQDIGNILKGIAAKQIEELADKTIEGEIVDDAEIIDVEIVDGDD